MQRARDGPTLRSTEGIDSLHLELSVNFADLKRFCKEQKLKLVREKNQQSKWQTVYYIFLAGERITVTYISRNKCTRFEFFRLYNYSGNTNQLKLIVTLIHYFSDRRYAISRLDYAVDVNIKLDKLLPMFKNMSPVYHNTTIYFNQYTKGKTKKKLSTVILYDKAKQLNLFSTPLTRIEIRLFRAEIVRKGLTQMFELPAAMMKTSNLLYALFETQLKLYTGGGALYKVQTHTSEILEDFIAFIHGAGSLAPRPDLFNIYQHLIRSKRILNWMNTEKITPSQVMKHVRGKKMAICKELQMDSDTFNKAIAYFTAPESES